MAGACFDVVFNGEIIDGFDRNEVKSRFVELFSVTGKTVERIFSAHNLTLKSNVDEQTAKAFQAALANIGVGVVIKSRAPSAELAAIGPVAVNVADAQPTVVPIDPEVAGQADAGGADLTGGAHKLCFSFSGNGGEYFKIWLANLLFGLVTLGIYSAWAKVRSKRYFYEHTQLDGSAFEYLGNPVSILKSRVGFVAAVFSGVVAVNISYMAAGLLVAGLVFLIPWWVVRSLAFNAHNSAYRNIRFCFKGSVVDAGKVFLGWPLLALVTLGMLAPAALCRQQAFLVQNCFYGRRAFAFSATPPDYYLLSVVATSLGLLGAIATFFLFQIAAPVGLLAGVAVYVAIFSYCAISYATIGLNAVSLGDYRFRAHGGAVSYAPLLVANTLAVIATLGIYLPWARARAVRYRCHHVHIVAAADTDNFIAAELERVGLSGRDHFLFGYDRAG